METVQDLVAPTKSKEIPIPENEGATPKPEELVLSVLPIVADSPVTEGGANPEEGKVIQGGSISEEEQKLIDGLLMIAVNGSEKELQSKSEEEQEILIRSLTPSMVQRGAGEGAEPVPIEGGGVGVPEGMEGVDPQIYQNTAVDNPLTQESPENLEDREGVDPQIYQYLALASRGTEGLVVGGYTFQTRPSAKGLSFTPIRQKGNRPVSEIAMFEVDDSSNKIGNLSPRDPGYLAAAVARAKTIFSTLGGGFFDQSTREIAIEPNRFYHLLEIEDGSLSELAQAIAEGKTPDNVNYSMFQEKPYPIQISLNEDASGYEVSIDNDELVLKVEGIVDSLMNTPIGAKSQSLAAGRVYDLSDYVGQNLISNLSTRGESLYRNQIGFYEVTDSNGSIQLADGTIVKPGDANYAEEAIKKAIANAQFLAGEGDSKGNLTIAGGKIYAPVVVSQGTFQEFLDRNPTNIGGENNINAYFNYIGANSDRVDHFRLIGNNTFAVEDQFGGGDRDYNDMIVSMNFNP